MPSFYEAAGQALVSRATRQKCGVVADRIAETLHRLAAVEQLDVTISRVDGTRPKGRPFSRVLVTGEDEWGTSGTPKRRIIARAAAASARTGRR
jgi:hypothetical protein